MSKTTPEVSVIVPVYNVKQYLPQCLQSILGQSLANIEVICVDDGSTDGSGGILDEYGKKDERLKVIHRDNAGYGSAVNEGIAHACGRYLSIVEPDDFIDTHMYEEMLAFSDFNDSTHDIIKASYWEFYDGVDEIGDIYLRPNMSKMNPSYPCVTTLEGNISFIEHHPSIWSALYRREFIEDYGIRFKECPGAAWVDNPFMLETFMCASSIVWVPKEYYCYRQTNENASTRIKDYHMPLDRIHDLFDLAEKYDAAPAILEALYVRAFGYMRSIVGEYGFDERDLQVREAMGRVLDRMDSAFVDSFEKISVENRAFYKEWHSTPHNAHDETLARQVTQGAYEFPFVSYIVPIAGTKEQLLMFVNACEHAPIDAYEILLVDEGERGTIYEEAVMLAKSDACVRLVSGEECSNAATMQEALRSARGHFCCVLNDMRARPVSNNFAQALLTSFELDVDLMILDNSQRYLVDAFSASGVMKPYYQNIDSSDNVIISYSFLSTRASSFALNATPLQGPGFIVKRACLQKHLEDLFFEGDRSNRMILARLLHQNVKLAYAAGVFFSVDTPAPTLLKPLLSLDNPLYEKARFCVPHALAIAQDDTLMQTYATSVVTYLLDAFVEDVYACPHPDALLEYLSLFIEPIGDVVDLYSASLHMQDNESYQLYIQARTEGPAKLIAALYCTERITSYDLAHRIDDIEKSRTFRLGKKIVETGRALRFAHPRSIIGSFKNTQ